MTIHPWAGFSVHLASTDAKTTEKDQGIGNKKNPVTLATQRLRESTTRCKKGQGQLVRMRSPVQIWVAAPKIPENLGFRGFFVAKSYFAGWLKISDPHRDPHAEMKQRNQWKQEWRTGKWASCPAHFSFCRYRTCSMKLPMAAAASFCFCLVALV